MAGFIHRAAGWVREVLGVAMREGLVSTWNGEDADAECKRELLGEG